MTALPMQYFELDQDLYIPGRWYPGCPVDGRGEKAGSWIFTRGRFASVQEPLKVGFSVPGTPLDFSLADAGTVPIVHPKVAEVFTSLAPGDLQVWPIQVEGQPDPYVLVNVTRLVDCIDDAASEHVERWVPEDEDDQPERAGEYRNVVGMRIDTSRVGGAKVFRPWGWATVLVVSEDIKDALERTGATGMLFREV
ncbi:imm11 family protein [Pyxidicoccus sp. 3LFB2]